MRADEILVDISFPAMNENQRGTFIKLGLRRAQAISVVDAAVILTLEKDGEKTWPARNVAQAAITLGSVAPVIIHAEQAESYLKGKILDDETIEAAARLAGGAARPIDDVRGSGDYRREMVRVCTLRGLRSMVDGKDSTKIPLQPVLLWGSHYDGSAPIISSISHHEDLSPIQTRINGVDYTFRSGHDKTLLRLLREEAGLIGTKEGCAEGECGACTVFLDGIAVMSCLVPAARAHQAEIVTIEGIAQDHYLHPVQRAFIEEGAVQCGYCTPGFIMSAVKLLEEIPKPSSEDIRQAITGNLCRCTGYYKILTAIERASALEEINE
jgi:carbon-monoxide dehydrogenase medium subunit